MTSSRPPRTMLVRLLLPAALAAACGGGGSTPAPDARPIGDAGPDGPPLPAGCDFVEFDDANNDFFENGAAETTGLTLSNKITVCGTIHSNHFEAQFMLVDMDAYRVQLPAGRVMLRLSGAFEGLDNVFLMLLSGPPEEVDYMAFSTAAGNYGASAVPVPAGTYTLAVIAERGTALPADTDYKLSIEVDDLDARCAPLTTAASYTEANDGPAHDGNDMVEVRFFSEPERALTAAADTPEPSGITTGGATRSRITGTMGDVDAADEYRDRDTYMFSTGDHDQLTVRVDWAGGTADLDLFVFPEGESFELDSSTRVGTSGPEYATFAVPRNTRFWLWVGAYDDATALPVTYDLTVCGESSTP